VNSYQAKQLPYSPNFELFIVNVLSKKLENACTNLKPYMIFEVGCARHHAKLFQIEY
ncbi:Hypothetical predicted protein, partial [Mytilus galloprovincialis]